MAIGDIWAGNWTGFRPPRFSQFESKQVQFFSGGFSEFFKADLSSPLTRVSALEGRASQQAISDFWAKFLPH